MNEERNAVLLIMMDQIERLVTLKHMVRLLLQQGKVEEALALLQAPADCKEH